MAKLFVGLVVIYSVAERRLESSRISPTVRKSVDLLQDDPAISFSAYDSRHYLRLSEEGYVAGSASCAFYPLWPATIRLVTLVIRGRTLLAALILANILSLVAFWLFYRLVAQRYGSRIAVDALALLLAFPGSLFFCFAYSESLYLLLVIVFFLGLEHHRHLWSGISGFLLPLARPVGIFITIPLAWQLYGPQQKLTDDPLTEGTARQTSAAPSRFPPWLLLLFPFLGYAAYFVLMWLSTGNPFEGFDAEKNYPTAPSISNIFNFGGFFQALLNVRTFDGMTDSALDRVLFVAFLALLWPVFRLDKTWFLYVFSTGLVPALSCWFVSYRRYSAVLFPVFIAMALLLAQKKHRWLFWYYILLLAALQAWAVMQFVHNHWAG